MQGWPPSSGMRAVRATDVTDHLPVGSRQFGEPVPPCIACGTPLAQEFLDLGMAPPCQTVVRPERVAVAEQFFPLRTWVCHSCWLVQVEAVVAADTLFDAEYPYFSSFSDSWLAHARDYVRHIVDRRSLDASSTVVEVGSNDGYLLQYVMQEGIRCMGVDPSASVADTANARGIPTRVDFFGADVARQMVAEGWQADVVCGANVMAQVPDPGDFVEGLATLVKPDGVVTIEFPHLAHLLERVEFDTIYHEHFSYFSLGSTQRLFARHGLTVTDVQELPSHGGSLRVFAEPGEQQPSAAVTDLLRRERDEHRLEDPRTYDGFADAVLAVREGLLAFLHEQRAAGRQVVGYGAPGKGNTLLNTCGIRADLLAYTVDRNPAKQGTYLPGSRIPVFAPEMIDRTRPDVILVLPWNLRREIGAQLAHTAGWGAQLAVAIPSLELFAPG